jgi:hypothetical protein
MSQRDFSFCDIGDAVRDLTLAFKSIFDRNNWKFKQ